MMKKHQWFTVAALAMAAGACGDVTAVPSATPPQPFEMVAPPPMDGEQTPIVAEGGATIYPGATRTTVTLVQNALFVAESTMDFDAQWGTTELSITARHENKADSKSDPITGQATEQAWPGRRQFKTRNTAPALGTCGWRADAFAKHRAWNGPIPNTPLANGERSVATLETFHTLLQQRCPTTPTGNQKPGTGTGDSGSNCYTAIIDHYWYYPDTGEIEYRYTDTRTVCNTSQY